MFHIWHYEPSSDANTAFRFIFHDDLPTIPVGGPCRFFQEEAHQISICSYHTSPMQCNASFLLEFEVEEEDLTSSSRTQRINKATLTNPLSNECCLHYVLRLWSFQEPSYRLASSVSVGPFVYSDLSGNN